jgi:hypothetical protein
LQRRDDEENFNDFCSTTSNTSSSHSSPAFAFPISDFTTASTLIPANLNGSHQVIVSGKANDNGQNSNATATPQIVIYSGLGQNVSVVQQFIPYNGGFIHIISG